MSRVGQISGFHGHISPLDGLRHHSRAVQVKVFEYGRETDSFSLADPSGLRTELRAMFALSSKNDVLELTGVEEEWLLMGFRRVRRETHLETLADALFFLAA